MRYRDLLRRQAESGRRRIADREIPVRKKKSKITDVKYPSVKRNKQKLK